MGVFLEPCILNGLALLQHLVLGACEIVGRSEGLQEFLSLLQRMQQLTYLDLGVTLCALAPAAAYSALTASSKLQHLGLYMCTLPAGVGQYMFPPSRQLPQLQALFISDVRVPDGPAVAPDGSSLVSCCPGLQLLSMDGLQYHAELFAKLQGLSSLHELHLRPAGESPAGLELVGQLTSLRELRVTIPTEAEGLLLKLTQLQGLTSLRLKGKLCNMNLCNKVGGDNCS